MYGTGAVINPGGDPSDGKFEVVIIRKLAFSELFNMMLFHKPFNSEKVEIFPTTSALLKTKRGTYFQSDGEFLGRKQVIKAQIIPRQLNLLIQQE